MAGRLRALLDLQHYYLCLLAAVAEKKFDIIHYSQTAYPFFFANVVTLDFCEREYLSLKEAGMSDMPGATVLRKLKAFDYKMICRLLSFMEKLTFGRKSCKLRIAASERIKKGNRSPAREV